MTFVRSLLAVLVILVVCTYITPARAATITVDTLSDAKTNEGKCSIREALEAASLNTPVNECIAGDLSTEDDIIFDASLFPGLLKLGTIWLNNSLTVNGSGKIKLTAPDGVSLTIDGSNSGTPIPHMISVQMDAGETTRFTIGNMLLRAGTVGIDIQSGGSVVLEDMALSDMGSNAIYVDTSNEIFVGIERSTFRLNSKNRASGLVTGGAIEVDTTTKAKLNINESQFLNNQYRAINFHIGSNDSRLTVRNSNFHDTAEGGAINVEFGTTTGGQFILEDSTFSNNMGGAVYVYSLDSGHTNEFLAERNNFENNTASFPSNYAYGGAVSVLGVKAQLVNNQFIQNTALTDSGIDAGALTLHLVGEIKLLHNSFHGNSGFTAEDLLINLAGNNDQPDANQLRGNLFTRDALGKGSAVCVIPDDPAIATTENMVAHSSCKMSAEDKQIKSDGISLKQDNNRNFIWPAQSSPAIDAVPACIPTGDVRFQARPTNGNPASPDGCDYGAVEKAAGIQVTINTDGSGFGKVTSELSKQACVTGPCALVSSMEDGLITLTASPSANNVFAGWSGDCSGTGNCVLAPDADKNITATFNSGTSALLYVDVAGNGTVSSNLNGIHCGQQCNSRFATGSVVELTATAASDSVFTGWRGACNGTGTCSVTVNSSQTVVANFALKQTPLTVSVNGDGVVRGVGIHCPSDCDATYLANQVVTLTATPVNGAQLGSWSGACSGSETACEVTMSEAQHVTATFGEQQTQPVTVAANNDSFGFVISDDGLLDSRDPNKTSRNIDQGKSVTVTAVPLIGHFFTGWAVSSPCAAVLSSTCTFTVGEENTVKAYFQVFDADKKTLSVGISGVSLPNRAGLVSGNIFCPGKSCIIQEATNSVAELYASGASQDGVRMDFDSWSGACSASNTSVCFVLMDEDKQATAHFVTSRAIKVFAGEPEYGTISSQDGRFGAEQNGESVYVPEGTQLVLTAEPKPGFQFSQWWGKGCEGVTQPQCTLTVTTEETSILEIGADFVPASFEQHDLIVRLSGNGNGQVTGTGINCPDDCAQPYSPGTLVTLTATPATDSSFVRWEGTACSGQNTNICNVGMDAAKDALAIFVNREVRVYAESRGFGHVVSADGKLDTRDPNKRRAAFGNGTSISVTATPEPGFRFVDWEGTCSGSTNPTCNFTLLASESESSVIYSGANFAPVDASQFALSLRIDGNGQISGNGLDCSHDCGKMYAPDTAVTLTATPEPGHRFVEWRVHPKGNSSADVCDDSSPTCSFTMDAAYSAYATFEPIEPNQYELSLHVTGEGYVDGSDIQCISTGNSHCKLKTQVYDANTVVMLVAREWYDFQSWSGACSGTELICTVTMDQARSVTANFGSVTRYPLKVNVNGAGTVSGSGIQCDASPNQDCEEEYAKNTVVTLTAIPKSGALFSGWSGACSTTATVCDVTMDQAKNVTANFAPIPADQVGLTVTVEGQGKVTGNGIDCPADCGQSYDKDTVVMLTATPAANATFTGWIGGCSSASGPTCNVTMSQAKTVRARFSGNNFSEVIFTSGFESVK